MWEKELKKFEAMEDWPEKLDYALRLRARIQNEEFDRLTYWVSIKNEKTGEILDPRKIWLPLKEK